MKAFFLSRLLREKLLMLLLVLAAAAMWLSGAGKRASAFWTDSQGTSAQLTMQTMWLGKRPAIEERAKNAVKQLDPSRTLDKLSLQAEVDRMVRGVGLTPNSGDGRSEPSQQFVLNTVQYNIRNADYGSLVTLYEELEKRAPYIGIENFTLIAAPSNPNQVNAVWRISSVQVK